MAARLLIVEDDAAVRGSLVEALADEGFPVAGASSAEEALARLGDHRPAVVLSDIRMPGLDGIELLEVLWDRAPDVDVILMTAYEDMPTVARAMREGAVEFLVKPLKIQDLLSILERVEEDRQEREARRGRAGVPGTKETAEGPRASADESSSGAVVEEEGGAEAGGLETLIGRHPSMIEVYKQVGRVAASRGRWRSRAGRWVPALHPRQSPHGAGHHLVSGGPSPGSLACPPDRQATTGDRTRRRRDRGSSDDLDPVAGDGSVDTVC